MSKLSLNDISNDIFKHIPNNSIDKNMLNEEVIEVIDSINNYQTSTDNNLNTTDKNIVGAINELLTLYTKESYSITYNASNVTYNYQPTSITSSEYANIVVTCNDGYVLNSIVVTMNGTDITNDCLSDLDYVGDTQNLIVLSNVTGDIVITISVN